MKTLEELTDQELSEAFAVEVAGWRRRIATVENPVEQGGMRLPNHFSLKTIEAWTSESELRHTGVYSGPPSFATDANAVLPWLEKDVWQGGFQPGSPGYNWVRVPNGNGHATTFARAACIALIKSQRAATAPTA